MKLILGLVSSLKDYRACYFINKSLKINLERNDENIFVHTPKQKIAWPYFSFFNNMGSYYFFSNSYEKHTLIKKYKNIDHWLISDLDDIAEKEKKIIEELRKNADFMAVFKVEDTLESEKLLSLIPL
jgi:hypothetical protein